MMIILELLVYRRQISATWRWWISDRSNLTSIINAHIGMWLGSSIINVTLKCTSFEFSGNAFSVCMIINK